ncbi:MULTISPECIES: hypothetical protein [Micromonospora]|uniref:Uncharacterized protein n=1 Tax=Micromonospora yangpuensis TaxID=683228 RepID=A0A1C6UM99_9ACTN|nr:hypothetical protein [Micromonospora yangpuensis]GGM27700.1 hypothetical protein GCM10012279_52850 [Micromonospora yangpuensis]SCL55147.1 hypothetical protein GA0070617_2875 [Micromonospora yangpuensis]
MTASPPERGEIRVQNGVVQTYDGQRWVPYRRLVEADPGPLVRAEPDDGATPGQADPDDGAAPDQPDDSPS